MLLRTFALVSLCITCSLAGICQDVFKNPSEDRPFFKVFESQGVEIYYPKRDAKQEMFGIKIYKNQDLRRKDLHCDLCVNTTHVEDGCFKIKSTMLTVEPRDVLKYVTLGKFSGKTDVSVSPASKAEFTGKPNRTLISLSGSCVDDGLPFIFPSTAHRLRNPGGMRLQ